MQRLKTALVRARLTTQVFKTCAQHNTDNNSEDNYSCLAFIMYSVRHFTYIVCLTLTMTH